MILSDPLPYLIILRHKSHKSKQFWGGFGGGGGRLDRVNEMKKKSSAEIRGKPNQSYATLGKKISCNLNRLKNPIVILIYALTFEIIVILKYALTFEIIIVTKKAHLVYKIMN